MGAGRASLSDMETCLVGQGVLGVGQSVQLSHEVKHIRHGGLSGLGGLAGVRLALRLYRDCEALIPPGPRAPTTRRVRVPAAAIPTTIGTANLVLALPFHGRRQATFFIKRTTNAADLFFYVRGVQNRYPDEMQTGDGLVDKVHSDESALDSWWALGGAAPLSNDAGTTLSAVRHCGGGGDLQESYDELQLWIYGAAGGDANIHAESFGERVL